MFLSPFKATRYIALHTARIGAACTRETKIRSNSEGELLTFNLLVEDAGRDVFGVSHLGDQETRLSEIG